MIYQPPSDSVSGTVIWTSARGLSVRGGEPDVPGSWHHHVGHDATLETAHPVGEDDGRDAAQGLEALGQEAQGRCLILAAGEPHEATRLQARTAQKTWRPPSVPQSMTRCSPGTGYHGRYVRRSRRQAALVLATARRRLRAEPV